MTTYTSRGYSEAVAQAIVSRQQRYAFPVASPSAAGQTAPVLHRSFSVSNEPVRLQMPAWSEYVGRTLDVPLSRTQVNGGFRGDIDTYVLKDMVYLESRTDPVLQARTAARISTDNVRDFVFHVVVEGIAETTTGSAPSQKSAQFTPGILALDMNQCMQMARPVRSRVLAFFLPRHMVESAIGDAESIHGRVLGLDTPLTRVLQGQLKTLCNTFDAMSPDDMERNLRATAQLMVAAFGKQQRLGSGARAAARAVLHEQVKRYIRANLHSKELSRESLLGMFPVSRPTLYRMFENDGGLVSYIRNSRLREAADALIRSPEMSVAEIGHRLDFGSPSNFARAFRRTYGLAPKDFRAQGLEWLLR